MSQQKIDHRLLNHFLKLKIFDGLGRKQKSLEDVEDLLNNLKEEHLLLKTQQHLRKVCAEKGADEYQKSLEGALVQLRGAAAEIICNADTILRGDTNIKRGERISRQKREEYNMALKKPEAGVDYECVDAHQHVDKAIQTKWYSNASSKTIFTNDISTTLIDGLHWPILEIWTNASKVDSDVIKDNVVVSCRNSLSNRLTPQYLSNIKNLIKGSAVKPQKPLTPLWYQKIAVKACLKAFEKSDRGQLNVPCGWGKTLAGLWIGEGLGSKKTLALCPSKDLCRQIFSAWARNGSKKNIKRLVVCSDETVSHDAIAAYEDELDFAVVKDSDKLKELTQDCAEYEIICTYQSISKLIEAELDFDYGFFDEAHRTTQPDDHLFALGLFDRNIKIEKRLFATATRRFIHSRNSRCNTMEDESVYGPVFYQMSFSEAVRTGRSRKNDNVKIISPVKIVTNKITNQDLDRELIKHGVTRVGWDLAQTRMVACIIGFLKAVDTLNLKKSFIYTNRVNSAERLANDPANGISQFTDKIKAFHVNGNMRSSERQREFTSFLEQEYSVVTNARCLNEGVDCPLVDCVAFFNPRKSVIDIVQSVGRAMRVDKNNPDKVGCIYVPIFEDTEENIDEALYDSPYEVLVDVIRAMASHDDSLQDLLNKWLEDVGGGGDGDFPEIFEVIDGDDVDLEELRNAIVSQVMTVFRNGKWSIWQQRIGLAKKIKEKYGSPNFHNFMRKLPWAHPEDYKFADDPMITKEYITWTRNSLRLGQISESKHNELIDLNFEFEPEQQRWKIFTKLMSNLIKGYIQINSQSKINWGLAELEIDKWSEGHIKSKQEFKAFKSRFNAKNNEVVKKYNATINKDSRLIQCKNKGVCRTHLNEWQMDYLKDINWTPILACEAAEDELVSIVEKFLREGRNESQRGQNRWDFQNAHHHLSIRAEEKTGKIIFPAELKYDGLNLANLITFRRRPSKPSGQTEAGRKRAEYLEKLRLRTVKRLENLGVWMGDEDQDDWVWKQNLENWKQVNDGLTDDEEDKKFSKTFSVGIGISIKRGHLSEEKKKLLKEANWKTHLKTHDQELELKAIIEMGKVFGHTRLTGLVSSWNKKTTFADGLTYEMYRAVLNYRDRKTNGNLTTDEIAWAENNLPYWLWNEGIKERIFEEKVSVAKQWFEENPEAEFMHKGAEIDNPFPFPFSTNAKCGPKTAMVGKFLEGLRKERRRKNKDWEIEILDRELGEKWKRDAKDEPRILKVNYIPPNPTSGNKERYYVHLGMAKAPKGNSKARRAIVARFPTKLEAEKAMALMQKEVNKNPNYNPEKLRDDFAPLPYARNRWDEKSLDFLKKNYKRKSDSEIAKHLGRSTASVSSQRNKLGLGLAVDGRVNNGAHNHKK